VIINTLISLALQRPLAVSILSQVFPQHAVALQQLPSFHSLTLDHIFFARTGYTGEDGFEIALAHEHAVNLWQTLMQLKVQPCGLGARDTLRIEAGLNLYGHEMDDSVSPLEANMAWTSAWQPQERRFIGRSSLEAQQAAGAVVNKLVGLVMEERGVLRAQQVVRSKAGDANLEVHHHGIITSGTFSPTLNKSIALARVPDSMGEIGWVELRNKLVEVRVVPPRFVRKGQSLIG
jgi:aminomethyltransferase